MNKWQRRAIGILTLGGSSVGLAALLAHVSVSKLHGISLLISTIFAATFVYGITVGVLIIEEKGNSLSLALPFWLAQVPVFQSAWISYGLFTGAKFDILFLSDLTINYELSGGANFSLYLFPEQSTAVGVNVVAIIVCYLISKNRRRAL
jgi:hypothetical protein